MSRKRAFVIDGEIIVARTPCELQQNRLREWIRDELARRGLTQTELCRRSQGMMDDTHLSHLLDGSRGAGLKTLCALAVGFNVPIEVILRAGGMLPPVKDEQITLLLERTNALDPVARQYVLKVWSDLLTASELGLGGSSGLSTGSGTTTAPDP